MSVRNKVYAFFIYIIAFVCGGAAIYYSIKKANGVILTMLWMLAVILIIVASFLSFTAGDQGVM